MLSASFNKTFLSLHSVVAPNNLCSNLSCARQYIQLTWIYTTYGKISTWSPPNLNFTARINVRSKIRARFRVRVRVKDRVMVRVAFRVRVRFLLSIQ